MMDQSSSLVRAAALRKSALSLANSCSIGVEIRAVGRQIEDRGIGRGDRLADAGERVGRQVVEHHDVTGRERRRQELLDIGAKGRTGPMRGCGDPAPHSGPVEHQRRDDAGLPEPGDEGRGAPVMGWTPPDGIDVPWWWLLRTTGGRRPWKRLAPSASIWPSTCSRRTERAHPAPSCSARGSGASRC